MRDESWLLKGRESREGKTKEGMGDLGKLLEPQGINHGGEIRSMLHNRTQFKQVAHFKEKKRTNC